ncbi:MAG TPA: hypothetical protein VGM54_17985 [Chthoniobacter sp.]|jgi:hypothetical protein
MAAITPEPTASPPVASRNPWPWLALLGVVALLVGAAMWSVEKATSLAGAGVTKGLAVVKELGHEAATVVSAFRQQNIRQQFLSSAVTLEGTSRLQVATLKEDEIFRRKEQDSIAWGWISLPQVVVQADVPVEYSYYLDFNGSWEFTRENDLVTVHAPPLRPNAPAPDISKLTFYTLEGHVWQDDKAVRERLQGSMSSALRDRALEHVTLIREIARRQTERFVEKWLTDSFSDGHAFKVKVVFPDEAPAAPAGVEVRHAGN